ncbi:hypothetical protein TNCV_3710721 [Trichonephila clavipes]|uniref:Uncharacterized protein n=1 Tax=Trichonephila clavipes TaxID=2585209 RepID=A0A8X6RFU2_TRICX|nr:hypothetical protein TNCV_3710721 [Trichonephila clavipes]
MMSFLLRLRKGDLLDVVRELGVEVNGDQRKVEIKDRILQNEKNDIETIKAVMEGVLEKNEREKKERVRLIRVQEFEERRQMRELELERLRAKLRNKLKEQEFNMNSGDKRNNLANIYYLSGNRTAEFREPASKCKPLINQVVNKSGEDTTSCDFEKENCDPQ